MSCPPSDQQQGLIAAKQATEGGGCEGATNGAVAEGTKGGVTEEGQSDHNESVNDMKDFSKALSVRHVEIKMYN